MTILVTATSVRTRLASRGGRPSIEQLKKVRSSPRTAPNASFALPVKVGVSEIPIPSEPGRAA